MKFEPFELERIQSIWEHQVEINLSESGIHPVSLGDVRAMGLDMEQFERTPLGYIQTNGTKELRQGIAQLYPGATPDHVLVTNGSSEANFIVCQTLLESGDEALFETPNYMQFSGMARGMGAEVKTFPLGGDREWAPDFGALDAALGKRTRLVYLSNPNNPTGAVLAREAMQRMVRAIEASGSWLVSDEVYQGAEFEGETTPSFWGMSEKVIVTSGLSKAYGIPGARIGWIIGPPELIEQCWAQHDYTTICPGALSDLIARVAVRPENRKRLHARTREIIGGNLEYFAKWVEGFGGLLNYIPPKAGPIAFVKYNATIPSLDMVERIRKNQSVLIVPGAHMGMEGYLRFSLGVPIEMLAAGLERVGNELKLLPRA